MLLTDMGWKSIWRGLDGKTLMLTKEDKHERERLMKMCRKEKKKETQTRLNLMMLIQEQNKYKKKNILYYCRAIESTDDMEK